MKTINRDKIQRMIGNVGGNGGNGSSSADLAGYATQMWVEQNYISKEFFNTLFTIHGHDADDTANPPTDVIIEPNDTETVLDSIEAMVGLWTEEYLSALGQGSGGGGGGGTILTEPLASINLAGLGVPSGSNKVIAWNGSSWVYMTLGSGSGTVRSITAGTGLSGGTITTSGTIAISSDYQTKISHGETAYGWGNHADAGYLTASSSVITTLQGYFDASGHAKSALKLTTVSKTAWGRTYWTSGGVPDSIDGDIENAANIKIDNNKKVSWKKSGATNYLSMLTLDASNNFVIGESMANEGLATYVRGRSINFQTGTGSSGNHAASMSDAGLFTVEKLRIGSIVISEDTQNGGLHIESAGIYADTYVSALGAGSGGGSGSGITMADVWQAMAYTAPSTGSQQIHVSHLAQALTGYVKTSDLSSYVTLAGTQTITGSKTFSGNVTLSSGTFKAGIGGRFQTVCIECDANGTPTNRTGEINRYNSADLHLQYDSGTGSVTMCRQKFQFSENQGVSTLALGGNMLYLNAGSSSPLTTKAWQVSSDIRLKNKVSDADATAEQIAKAPIFDFTWKKEDGGQVFFGTSAQYWQEVFPNAVKKNGTLSMDYGATALGAAVIVARKVMTHEERIVALEKENKELKEKLETLKAS